MGKTEERSRPEGLWAVAPILMGILGCEGIAQPGDPEFGSGGPDLALGVDLTAELAQDATVVDRGLAADLVGQCMNGRKDPGETDNDCGGGCPKCAEGRACGWGGDCVMGACIEGHCARNRIVQRAAFPGHLVSAVVADITGDGLRDIVFGSLGRRFWGLERVKGATFRSLGTFDFDPRPAHGGGAMICLGDLTGDGILDLVSGTAFDREVIVARGTVGGGFVDPMAYRVSSEDKPGEGSRTVACGDFDGDGDVDAAVGGSIDGVMLLRNRGKGNLVVEPLFPRFGGAVGPAADMDGDGILDLAAGDMILTRRLSVRASCVRRDQGVVLIGDFNGDGRLDLGGTYEICFGDGRGGLQPARPVDGPRPPPWTGPNGWSGDLNGDGRSDIITSMFWGREVVVQIAFGQANGNLRFDSSLAQETDLYGLATGRALSETRDDLLVGLWAPMPNGIREVRILTFN